MWHTLLQWHQLSVSCLVGGEHVSATSNSSHSIVVEAMRLTYEDTIRHTANDERIVPLL
jgi:hypothetical protein